MLTLVISDQNGVLDEVRIVNLGHTKARDTPERQVRRYSWSLDRGDEASVQGVVRHNRCDGRYVLCRKVLLEMAKSETDKKENAND